MIGYLGTGWFGKAILEFLVFLNSMIYGLVGTVFRTFLYLMDSKLFSDSIVEAFLSRIYVVLGIYMLFKLSFSLLSSIVNPDNLADKEKGMGKIVSRTIIALVMLVFTPTIFSYALDWQDEIALALPRIIIGAGSGITSDQEDFVSQEDNFVSRGEELASTAIKAFFEGNPDCDSDVEFADSTISNTTGTVDSTLDLAFNVCTSDKSEYMFKFNGIVSMFAGLVLVFMILMYCLDIAIRIIKLGILRILAPIPIISYIDPKSEKSGSFANWLKECTSTYIEVFIKVTILYFVVFLLGGIARDNGSMFLLPAGAGGFVKLFIILGCFFFMGKAAAFICNILGVKAPEGSGGFLKTLAGIGAVAGIGAAAASGALTNYRGNIASQKARGVEKISKGRAIASAFMGGLTGLGVAGKAVAGAKGNKFAAANAAMYKRNAAYTEAAAGGATFFGKADAFLERSFTGQTEADALERDVKKLENRAKSTEDIVKYADDKARTSNKTLGTAEFTTSDGRSKRVSGNYQAWTHAFSAAKSQGLSQFEFNNETYTMHEAERLDYGLFTSNSECYIRNQGFGDVAFGDLVTDYNKVKTSDDKNIDSTVSRSDMKDQIDDLNSKKRAKEQEVKIAKANADAVKPK